MFLRSSNIYVDENTYWWSLSFFASPWVSAVSRALPMTLLEYNRNFMAIISYFQTKRRYFHRSGTSPGIMHSGRDFEEFFTTPNPKIVISFSPNPSWTANPSACYRAKCSRLEKPADFSDKQKYTSKYFNCFAIVRV